MLRKLTTAFIIATAFTSGTVSADTLIVSGIDTQAIDGPARGITQSTVESRWGEPIGKTSPVGNPPVSSWEYSTFVVYFEYDHVIHNVAKR